MSEQPTSKRVDLSLNGAVFGWAILTTHVNGDVEVTESFIPGGMLERLHQSGWGAQESGILFDHDILIPLPNKHNDEQVDHGGFEDR